MTTLKPKNRALLICVLICNTAISHGQVFKTLVDLGSRYDYSYAIEIQSDGKVLQAGDAYGKPCIIRFDTSGYLDNSFGNGGKVFADWSAGCNPAGGNINCQADGKIILGTSYWNDKDNDFIIARYNNDGTLDNSFGDGGKAITPIGLYNDICYAVAIQPDGKILAAGGTNNAPASNWRYDFALVRYNTNGTLDSSFGNNGVTVTNIGTINNIANSIAIQPDNKIILAGEAGDGKSDFATVRYNPDGSLDSSFGNNGIVRTKLSETYDFAKSVILQPDGKILVAGSSQSNLSNSNYAIIRYNTDGIVDSTFGINGIVSSDFGAGDFGEDIVLQADGSIILAGSNTTGTLYKFAALRYDSFGIIDNSFGDDGIIRVGYGYGSSEGQAVALSDNGEIIIAGFQNHGSPNYIDFALVRLFSNLAPNLSPTLISPQNESTESSNEQIFMWHPISEATSYTLQVSAYQDFNSTVVNKTDIYSTSYFTNGLSNNSIYYWRVAAIVDGVIEQWSETRSFTKGFVSAINTTKLAPYKLYPVPADDKLFIDGTKMIKVNVSILSATGRIVKQTEGLNIKAIDVSNLPGGVYLIKISDEQNNFVKYFTKK